MYQNASDITYIKNEASIPNKKIQFCKFMFDYMYNEKIFAINRFAQNSVSMHIIIIIIINLLKYFFVTRLEKLEYKINNI